MVNPPCFELGAASDSTSFEAAFARVLGARAIHDLKALLTETPVVLIAGSQLTGKSTAAKAVAARMGGMSAGTGSIVRKMAEERGISIEQMSREMDPDVDVAIDYRAACRIGGGEVAAFESRLAGHLGQFLERLGRKQIVSVYLEASPKERALRHLHREVSPAARARLEQQVHFEDGATLEQALAALVALGDPEASAIASKMGDIARRDEVDRGRMHALYGVDFQDQCAFDVVLDTTGRSPADMVEVILTEAVRVRAEKQRRGQ